MTVGRDESDRWDFFVSHTGADRRWAEWIAWRLEEDGYRVLLQSWDFAPGSNWVQGMQDAVSRAARTIVVLSSDYLDLVYGTPEWEVAWAADPAVPERKLLVTRVNASDRPGILATVVSVDLFGITEAEAQARLHSMVSSALAGRAKPETAPPFPSSPRVPPYEPPFPGRRESRERELREQLERVAQEKERSEQERRELELATRQLQEQLEELRLRESRQRAFLEQERRVERLARDRDQEERRDRDQEERRDRDRDRDDREEERLPREHVFREPVSERERRQPRFRRRSRYANVFLFDASKARRLGISDAVFPNDVVSLRVGIGPLEADSLVRRPAPFPEQVLPQEDVWLRVLVTSSDFTVGKSMRDLDNGIRACEQPLLLPADGSSARTEEGESLLDFLLRAPQRDGSARARICYYYRDSLVQSQLLVVSIGPGRDNLYAFTDFTASDRLDDLARIPDIPRLSVLVNDGPDGTHHLVLRAPGGTVADQPASQISLRDEAVGPVVEELRRRLAQLVAARRKPSRRQLIEDLRMLAPKGLELHRALFGQAKVLFGALMLRSPRPLLSVTRPSHVTFTIPWHCIYQIHLPDNMDIEDLPICPLVLEWNEQSPLVAGPTSECPRIDDANHNGPLLCPFGFYGYRQAIECASSTRDTEAEIPIHPNSVMAIGITDEGINRRALERHLDALSGLLSDSFPALNAVTKSSYSDLKQLLSTDLPLIYFFCHGQRSRRGNISLGFGRGDTISAGDFQDWVAASYADPPVIWSRIRPLVFINACQSLEITPSTLVSYEDAFIGAAGAVGTIGTEVKVPEDRAAEFAIEFFSNFIQYSNQYLSGLNPCPFERSLTAARFRFLQSGDLFGLAYTADARAHLHLRA